MSVSIKNIALIIAIASIVIVSVVLVSKKYTTSDSVPDILYDSKINENNNTKNTGHIDRDDKAVLLPIQDEKPTRKAVASKGCGNGIVEENEQCDDGNNEYTDNCTKFCQEATCGDGYIWQTKEQCDDGNIVNGDGCSAECKRETVGNICGSAENSTTCDKPLKSLCISDTPGEILYNRDIVSWEWKCGITTCSTTRECQ